MDPFLVHVLVNQVSCMGNHLAKEIRMNGQRSEANTRIVVAKAVRNKGVRGLVKSSSAH